MINVQTAQIRNQGIEKSMFPNKPPIDNDLKKLLDGIKNQDTFTPTPMNEHLKQELDSLQHLKELGIPINPFLVSPQARQHLWPQRKPQVVRNQFQPKLFGK
ncbi:MAG: hypothetical protein ACLFQV_04280 [Vulcanimicrobiota bacterium]